ncbi:MAG: acyl-[ACP]--phospholipid O-acyltransferase [Alphaproteobacteria bacterium]
MSASSYKRLLAKRGFIAYLWTEFLGAMNDNMFKMVLSLMAVNEAMRGTDGGLSAWSVSAVGAIFIAPYLIFSGLAGYFSDTNNKRYVLIATKTIEIFAMGLALIVLPMDMFWLAAFVLFLMATQSTFFSPAKYGILPEIFNERYLTRANGMVEMLTFIAIIVGGFFGAAMYGYFEDNKTWIGVILFAVAIIGWASVWWVPKVKFNGEKRDFPRNPWREVGRGLRRIKSDKRLSITVVGITWFWFLGALVQLSLLVLGKEALALDDFDTGLLQTFLAVGIAIGSLLAGRLSGDRIELGLVPLGSIGIGIGALTLYVGVPDYGSVWQSLIILGIFAGLYIIPLNATLQKRAENAERGSIIATTNFLSMSGVFLASAVLTIMHDFMGFSAATIIMIFGWLTIAVTVVGIVYQPRIFVRFILWIITHTIYRIVPVTAENIPKKGAALLVGNHVSHADGFFVGGAMQRHIRFMLYGPYYKFKFLNPLFRLMSVIPVMQGRKVMETIQQARDGLDKGDLVCIFAEGGLTRSGNILPFRKGMERIQEGRDTPILPVHLDNVWGSIFTFKGGKYFFKWPSLKPRRIAVTFGKLLPAGTSRHEVRQKIVEMGAEAIASRPDVNSTLGVQFLKQARKTPWRSCLLDSTGVSLNYFKTMVSSIILAGKIRQICKREKNVGVLLPASVGGALVNVALALTGRTSVNLNFSLGLEQQESAIKRANVKTILTSRKFLQKAGMAERPGMVFVEDFKKGITASEKLMVILKAIFYPARSIQASLADRKIKPDTTATIIFSSGTTGDPKGVELTHRNILSNLAGIGQVFPYTKRDRFLGVLPFFHSFGYTVTMWFPLARGLSVVYHPNPLDAKTIGKVAEQHKPTLLIATPTFMQTYTRVCSKEQFATIRFPIVGGEKLKPTVAAQFEEKFGVPLYEGYGCTELSPVVSVNIPNISVEPGFHNIGTKPGTIGLPVPGVAAKIVDQETREDLPFGETGMLLIKGAGVMKGYLKQPDRTAESMMGDWYITGDIAKIDTDGFITIVDRLARFSKIGGEMVPHGKVEEEINKILGGAYSIVVSIPHDKKGEALGVVYQHDSIEPKELWTKLKDTGLPSLWMPNVQLIKQLDVIPIMANGKADLRSAKKIIEEIA